MLHVHLDAPGEPLLEVLVELRLEVGHHLARAPHDQTLERPLLEVAHQRLSRVLEVVVLLLLDAALIAGLGPTALVVLAKDLVVDLLDLPEALRRAPEDPGVASVDERHAPALAPLEPCQRPDKRGVTDGHLVGNASWQLQRLEEVGLLAHEHRDAASAVGGQIVLQEAAGALERRLQGHAVVVGEAVLVPQPALGVVHERADGGLARRRRGELRGIEIQVEAQHDRSIKPQFGQLT